MKIKDSFAVFLCFIAFLLAVGCSDSNPAVLIDEINIELNIKNVRPQNLCDLDGKLKYIPLKAISNLLRTATLIEFYQNLILVSDHRTCLLFDLEGNVISRIGSQGKGPGEYVFLSNVGFGLHDKIIIQDTRYLNIYEYNGEFVERFKPESNPELGKALGTIYSWSKFNDSLYIGIIPNDSGKEKCKAVFFDESGKTFKTVPNFNFLNHQQRYTSTLNSEANIFKFKDNILIKQPLNDTVFLVNEDFCFVPSLFLYLGKYREPKEVRELPMLKGIEEGKKYILVKNIFASANYIFIDCDFRNNNPAKRPEPFVYKDNFGNPQVSDYYPARLLGIYDRISKELVFAEPLKSENRLINMGLGNDYDGGVNFYPTKYVNDSTLAMWVDAYQLKEHVASKAFKKSTPKYPEKKKKLEELANSLSDNDNPVLILCTFKN